MDLSPVFILLGPPGSGKGTQATLLSAHFRIPHISTGELFRAEIRAKTDLGLKAQGLIEQGHLVPDPLVIQMLEQRISQTDCALGFLLDGFPRTLPQAEQLTELLLNRFEPLVFSFEIDEETLLNRLSGRLTCRSCSRTFHRLFDPPLDPSRCDHCEGELFQRLDDHPDVIRKRLEVYHAQTEPLLQYYAAQGLHKVAATQSPDAIFQDLLKNLPSPALLKE